MAVKPGSIEGGQPIVIEGYGEIIEANLPWWVDCEWPEDILPLAPIEIEGSSEV